MAAAAGIFVFLSATCFLSLEMISAELENPFGDDVNDLPVTDIHNEFNETLQLLLHPILSNRFQLKRHRMSEVGDKSCWGQLDDCLSATQDGDPMSPRTTQGLATEEKDKSADQGRGEVGADGEEHTSQPLQESPSLNKVRMFTVTQRHDDVPPEGPPSSTRVAPAEVKPPRNIAETLLSAQKELNTSQWATPGCLEFSWILEDARIQRNFEEGILVRLDAIVDALTKPNRSNVGALPPGNRYTDRSKNYDAPLQGADSCQPQSDSLHQLPWMRDIVQRQRKVEEDILKRLDDILSALISSCVLQAHEPSSMPESNVAI